MSTKKYKGDIVLWCNYPGVPFVPTATISPVGGVHEWIDKNFFNKLKLDKWRESFSRVGESYSTLSLDKIRYDIGALFYMVTENLVDKDHLNRHCIKIDLTKYTGLTRPVDQVKLAEVVIESLRLPCMKNTVLHVFTNSDEFPDALRHTAFKNPEFVDHVTIFTPPSNKLDRKVISTPMVIGVTKKGKFYDKQKFKSPDEAEPIEFPAGFFDVDLDRLMEMM